MSGPSWIGVPDLYLICVAKSNTIMSYGAIDPGAESRAGEGGAGVARAGTSMVEAAVALSRESANPRSRSVVALSPKWHLHRLHAPLDRRRFDTHRCLGSGQRRRKSGTPEIRGPASWRGQTRDMRRSRPAFRLWNRALPLRRAAPCTALLGSRQARATSPRREPKTRSTPASFEKIPPEIPGLPRNGPGR